MTISYLRNCDDFGPPGFKKNWQAIFFVESDFTYGQVSKYKQKSNKNPTRLIDLHPLSQFLRRTCKDS